MTVLNELSSKDRDLVIGLFYRVGMWISYCDDEEGDLDDEREKNALERIILTAAKAHEKSDFVKNALKEAVRQKENWPRWEAQSANVLKDCEKAIALLKKHTVVYDVKVYKAMVYKIGEVVACAHGEFGMDDHDEGRMSQFMEKMSAKFRKENMDDKFMNISPTEAAYLERLKLVLQEKQKA